MADALSALASVYDAGPVGVTRATPGVTLQERPARNLVQLSGWPENFDTICDRIAALLGIRVPVDCLTVTTHDDLSIFRVGPMRLWFVSDTNSTRLSEFLGTLEAKDGVVTEINHSRTVLRIRGGRQDLKSINTIIEFARCKVERDHIAVDVQMRRFKRHDVIGVLIRANSQVRQHEILRNDQHVRIEYDLHLPELALLLLPRCGLWPVSIRGIRQVVNDQIDNPRRWARRNVIVQNRDVSLVSENGCVHGIEYPNHKRFVAFVVMVTVHLELDRLHCLTRSKHDLVGAQPDIFQDRQIEVRDVVTTATLKDDAVHQVGN